MLPSTWQTTALAARSDAELITRIQNSYTGGVDAKVASAKIHPDYTDGESPWHDIGILKLSDPIEQSAIISYAKLPVNGSDPAVNSTATAAGW